MPSDEFDKWMEYFRWKADQEKAARKEAERKSKSGKGKKSGKRVIEY